MASAYSESISLSNSLLIRNISDLYATITARIQGGNAIILDIPPDADADLSFVQLVESARIHAKSSGKTFGLSSPASGSVLKVLQRGGFIDAFSVEDAQFWLHKEVHQ